MISFKEFCLINEDVSKYEVMNKADAYKVDGDKFCLIFKHYYIFADGITGITLYQDRLYDFDSKEKAEKHINKFYAFQKEKLGKSVGKQSKSGFLEKEGIAYGSKENILIKQIKDVDDYRVGEITYYSIKRKINENI